MNNTIKLITLSILLFGAACKKHSHTADDQAKPIITIAEPMANDTLYLSMEPEIHIEFTTTDNEGLHELNVMLIKNNTDTLLNDKPTVHDLKTYAYHEHIMPTGVASMVSMKLIIKAEDHGGNEETKAYEFYVAP